MKFFPTNKMQKLYHTKIFAISLIISLYIPFIISNTSDPPVPTTWPHQFHALLFMNTTDGALQKVDLWYDWPNGRNFNIIQNQLAKLYYDLEWGNGTSYVYTLDKDKECRVLNFPVGILRPNWLDGATYLGQKYMDGFLCNLWEKVDFIWYYEDVATRRPVYWAFYSVLEDREWQAPAYCFGEGVEEQTPFFKILGVPATMGKLMRGAKKIVTPN